MSRIRLLMLNYEFPPIGGGAGTQHLALLREYAKTGDLDVDVLVTTADADMRTERLGENVTIQYMPIRKKDLHYWRKSEVIEFLIKAGPLYRRLLKKRDYHLVHAFSGFPTGWLSYRTKKAIPYMISLLGSDVPGPNARLKLDYTILAPVFRAIWKQSVSLVACSDGLKDRALDFYPKASVDVIPNGVDQDRFYRRQSGHRWQGVSTSSEGSLPPLRLLAVGRLTATKRVELLIDAVGRLRKRKIDVSLKVVGGGALAGELQELVRLRGLTDVIDLAGRLDPAELPGAYRDADMLLSASMQEGMSNAMLEAIASGLPILTTRCEGVEELISDNGQILEGDGAEDLANEIIRLIGCPQDITKMSDAALEKAKQYTWSSAARQYIELYRRIIATRGSKS